MSSTFVKTTVITLGCLIPAFIQCMDRSLLSLKAMRRQLNSMNLCETDPRSAHVTPAQSRAFANRRRDQGKKSPTLKRSTRGSGTRHEQRDVRNHISDHIHEKLRPFNY